MGCSSVGGKTISSGSWHSSRSSRRMHSPSLAWRMLGIGIRPKCVLDTRAPVAHDPATFVTVRPVGRVVWANPAAFLPSDAHESGAPSRNVPDRYRRRNDMIWLTKKDLTRTEPAEVAAFRSPIPTQMVSNGEFMPAQQTRAQRQVEERIKMLADRFGSQLGLNRRKFLQTS